MTLIRCNTNGLGRETIVGRAIVGKGSSDDGKSLSNNASDDPRPLATLATHNYSPSARADESSQDKFAHADGRKCIGLKINYAISKLQQKYTPSEWRDPRK